MCREWNARAVGSTRATTRAAVSRACSASIASTPPATTHWLGALTAASSSPSPSQPATWASGAPTASIPPGGVVAISRPRAAISWSASASENTPAWHAATYSPTLWPIIAAGRTPQARHCWASAYSMANSAGCVISVWFSRRSASRARSRSRRSRPIVGASSRAHSARLPRNTGAVSSSRSAVAIPGYWLPWPGNRNTAPSTAAARGAGTRARSWALALARSPHTTVARQGNARRPCCRVCATSASASRSSASSCAARRAATWASAVGVRAEIGRSSRLRDGEAVRSGASSSTAWALVPPIPNELTPARRGAAERGQARAVALTKNGVCSNAICGFARSKCRLGGRTPWWSASAVLMSPATPAALSRWPRLDLSEPIAQDSRAGASPNARHSPWISVGSPTAVPVPWASTYEIVSGATSAMAWAVAITSAWPSMLGAVNPILWPPSLLTAAPRITA